MSSSTARCGYSADLSLGVNDRTMLHADNAYYYPAARIHSRRVRTDTVSNTAFRGFGGPQGMLFAERMMDAIAITLELDPLVVRKRNLYAPGRDVTPYGMHIEDHVVPRLIRRLERTSGYAARRRAIARFNSQGGHRRTGARAAGRTEGHAAERCARASRSPPSSSGSRSPSSSSIRQGRW